jgi:hypothetical protein
MRSTTEENDSASVSLLNLPSHDTAVPTKPTEINSGYWQGQLSHTCSKCSKQIIHSQRACNPDSEQRQGEILSHERFAIRQASVMREIQDLAESISCRTLRTGRLLLCSSTRALTHHSAEQGAQDNLVYEQGTVSSEWGVESRLKNYRAIRRGTTCQKLPFS